MKTKLQILLLATALCATQASASVRVYGEASSTGPNITVQVFADITSPAIVSHTFKLFYPARQLEVLSATRNSDVWYMHNGASVVPYAAPDTGTPGEVLFIGARMDGRNPLAGVLGTRVLLGTVQFARNDSDTPSFDMTIGRSGQFASFVGTNGAVLEATPGEVNMLSVKPNPADEDLDGLSDKWEDRFFGTTRGVFYSDDKDGDGVNNLGEEAMGSDPTDSKSNLRLLISERRDRVLLEWTSAEERSYTIEGAKVLGKFETLKEGISATPPMNSFEFDRSDLPDTFFFRIRVEALPAR